jgi:hypothetical protein
MATALATAPVTAFAPGDRCHYRIGTDVIPCTVHHVAGNRRKLVVIDDDVTIDPAWKEAIQIIPGGFAGHCVNQNEQKWICTPADPERGGIRRTFTLRKDGFFLMQGARFGDPWAPRLRPGTRRFHDYNF